MNLSTSKQIMRIVFCLISMIVFGQNSSTNPPNIIFILLDDLGKEWVEAYESDVIKTPHIDQLASEGMQFNNAWSMPQCTPSRVTFLTGQYPFRHGWVNHYDVPRWGHGVNFDSKKNPSVAKLMKTAGYKTCAAGKWQINDFRIQPEVMNDHGFDAYCMWTGGERGNTEKSDLRYWDPYIHTKSGSKTYKGQFGEDIFSDFIIDFMAENKSQPMFVYYPMCLPHGPLTTTPAKPNAKTKAEKHIAMVEYTDLILNKITTALNELGIRDNTIIVWSTDNGTSGSITGKRKGKLVRGGKSFLTENGVNAPFIVNCPGTVPSGVVTNALVDFSDLLPTFTDLAGVKLPTNYDFDGKSFKNLITGKSTNSKRDWILTMGSNPAKLDAENKARSLFKFRDRAIRDEVYKAYTDTLKNVVEIYRLEDDFYETQNLIESKDKAVKKALNKFQNLVNGFPDTDASPNYETLKSPSDIEKKKINASAEGRRFRTNHAPMPKALTE